MQILDHWNVTVFAELALFYTKAINSHPFLHKLLLYYGVQLNHSPDNFP